jgi:[ribosomal protein S5]-alanine N-acetyltransferase
MTPAWPVELQDKEVGLRPLRRRDRRRWIEVRQRNREWLSPWEATNPMVSEEDGFGLDGRLSYLGMVAAYQREARAGRMLPFVVTYRGHLAGQLTVGGITLGAFRGAHIGYWIDQRVAGRGITPIAVALAADYCFDVMRLHRIEINIRPENVNSRRVAEKCGFQEEGVRRAYLHIDGEWRDHITYVMSVEERPEGGVLEVVRHTARDAS